MVLEITAFEIYSDCIDLNRRPGTDHNIESDCPGSHNNAGFDHHNTSVHFHVVQQSLEVEEHQMRPEVCLYNQKVCQYSSNCDLH